MMSASSAENLTKENKEAIMHKENCPSNEKDEWSGYPNPEDPANSWICDDCGAVIPCEEGNDDER